MIEFTLKESFNKTGCPVCRTIRIEMDNFFKWFERENYHEYSSLEELYKHSYICDKHKSRLIKMTEKLNNTFEFLIEKDLSFLSSLKDLAPRKIAKELKQIDPSCRFCLEEKRIEKHIIKTLSNSPDLINIYLKSPSILCKKHLILILVNTKGKNIQIEIINKAKAYLKDVYGFIESYFEKIGFNSKEKPSSQEKEAYKRALSFYSSQLEPPDEK